MKIKPGDIIFLVSLNLCHSLSHGQIAGKLSEESKDSLVQIAVALIEERSFVLSDYDQLSIWKIRGDTSVHFDRFIRFVPLKGRFLYDVTVSLNGSILGGTSLANNKWSSKNSDRIDAWSIRFFRLSRRQISKTRFVQENLEAVIPGKYLVSIREKGHLTIREERDHFSITVEEPQRIYSCRMKKRTGKVFDEQRIELRLLPDGEPGRVRIY